VSNKDERQPVEKAWAILRAGSSDTSGLEIATLPAEVSTADGPVRFALGRNGEARLLLPLSNREAGKEVTGAAALQITVSAYTQGRKQQRFLDLICLAHELEKVFTELGDEILSRVDAGVGCVEAARSTIEEFRSLLVRPNSSQVPVSQVAGFVGELVVLNRLLDRDPTAWKSWRGPAGDRHDFASGAHALEVKASLSKGRSTISVNGFDQLERPAGGSLHLLHFELEAVGSGMLLVEALGIAALGKASEPENLQRLLSAIGCEDVRDPAWNHIAFRQEAENLFRVEEGFPRLVTSMLAAGSPPAGVSNVSYAVDLSTAEEFRLDPSETAKIEELLL
jgi:putative PD-(D/E)XK family protein DUF4420